MSQISNRRALVVGSGSIGYRHLNNLRLLGIEPLASCDPDPTRLARIESELSIQTFLDFEVALKKFKPNLVFICTPPVFHVKQALQAIRAKADVFIEKPLSHTLEGVDELMAEAEAGHQTVQIGYNLRFHPGLCKLKELIADGVLGRIFWAHAEVGQYLPDWRPWQDYRQSYTARHDLGGGIILDASHELDYILWLLGEPIEVLCMANKVSNLEVDVEDCATILLRFPSGAQADVHLDFVQRVYSRSCKIAGEKGTALWNDATNELRVYHTQTASWETFPYACSNNDTYVAEVQDYLECVQKRTTPRVNLEQARRVLNVALSAKSNSQQRTVGVTS